MDDTDRELLELAAKAAGYSINEEYSKPYYPENCKPDAEKPSLLIWNVGVWNPLTDDGDALRLAVKLGISISFSHSTGLDVPYPTILEVGAFAGWCPTYTESNAEDWASATRRAIVRAAAELARAGAQKG